MMGPNRIENHDGLHEELILTRRQFLVKAGLTIGAGILTANEMVSVLSCHLGLYYNPIRQDSLLRTNKLFVNERYCIYHLTDFHLCEYGIFTKQKLQSLIEKINKEIRESGFTKKQIIVYLTGDFVNSRGATDESFFVDTVQEFAKLQINPEHVFFVTGNHDILSFEESIVDTLTGLGFRYADGVVLDHNLPFNIIGTQDFCTRGLQYAPEICNNLIGGINRDLFSFLITHDPTVLQYNLRELLRSANGLASFTGHTHHFLSNGSIFSLSQTLRSTIAQYQLKKGGTTGLIANREFGSGYYMYDQNTHLFNTNGLGDHPRITFGFGALGRDAPYTYRRVIVEGTKVA